MKFIQNEEWTTGKELNIKNKTKTPNMNDCGDTFSPPTLTNVSGYIPFAVKYDCFLSGLLSHEITLLCILIRVGLRRAEMGRVGSLASAVRGHNRVKGIIEGNGEGN